MVSNTHNNLPGEQEQHTHSFAERVKKGAENAVHCMGVSAYRPRGYSHRL